jgi:menaquinol-cytochrome c reductase iron-sulfur subunit
VSHEAQAYLDPGTPEEQTRRQFMVNATLGIGAIIGLVIAVPTLTSLVPESMLKGAGGGTWAPMPEAELKALQAATDTPVKISVNFKAKDAYLPESDVSHFAWGVKLTDEQVKNYKKLRPDIYDKPGGNVPYPVVNLNFVIFSSVCPHLACLYSWVPEAKRFICPCHGSQFGIEGNYLAGPSPRGLDPLPFREANGKAEVTWINYKVQQPSRLIVSYT